MVWPPWLRGGLKVVAKSGLHEPYFVLLRDVAPDVDVDVVPDAKADAVSDAMRWPA